VGCWVAVEAPRGCAGWSNFVVDAGKVWDSMQCFDAMLLKTVVRDKYVKDVR
jgi:hypothetical protein